MANATATLTLYPYPKGVDNTQRNQVLRGTVAISAGDYPDGGLSLSWGGLTNATGAVAPQAVPPFGSSPSSSGTLQPIDADFKSVGYAATAGGHGPSGYVYLWDNVNGNLHIFQSNNGVSNVSGPLIESVTGGTIPGAVINDTIEFTAVFTRD